MPETFHPRIRAKNRPLPLFFAAALHLCLPRGSLHGNTPENLEYQVKAALLLKIAQFVEWPPESFPQEDTPLTIGILGKDPFDPILEKTAEDKTVNGRKILVRRFKQFDELQACHLLFISSGEEAQMDQVLAKQEEIKALTVSDGERFAEQGGMVSLVKKDGKIGMKINVDSAKRANVVISAKLLKLAEIVRGSNRTDKK